MSISISENERRAWDRRTPYYLRVRDHLAGLIEAGTLAVDSRLPAERDLSEAFQITRVTAHQALIQLEMEGLIYRLNRRGWFVSPPRLRYNPSVNVSFTRNVTASGRMPGTAILGRREVASTPWLREKLGAGHDDTIYLVERVRLIDDRPVLVEHIHLNAKYCPGLLTLPLEVSLTDILEQHFGIQLRRASVQLHPTALTAAQAEALGVSAGLPGLKISRAASDQNGNIIEFDQEYWRHDALEVHVDVAVDTFPRHVGSGDD